ncbi:MAG TPA: RimK family protein [Vicinamibacteria bacterium]|nr:RimK family protein [Vicinamibacteria bacterium]
MPTLVVVNNPKLWPFHIPGVEVVAARAYLTGPEFGEMKGVKLFNLCRSYRYQSTGYYVTLLAAARGHRPLPTIATFQDLRSPTMARVVSEDLDDLIQTSLSRIQSKEFVLSVYFGRNLAKRYDRLSHELFNLFQAPLLRARFVYMEKWHLKYIAPVSMGDVPESHRSFLLQVAQGYFGGRGPRVRKRRPAKYDLAILVNPEEKLPPSDPVAIRRFAKAAEDVGLATQVIGPDDYGRLAEFDALFIRETTSVNHHTYRFARRAAFEGLVVVDDPESIVKCSNKVFLAELLKRHEIPTPPTLVVHRGNVESIPAELGLPIVLKKPDSSFSHGVVKVETEDELDAAVESFFEESDLVVAQQFVPTEFDWRIGVLNRRPLFACKYFMAKKHWQIYKHEGTGKSKAGPWETLPVELAPRKVVRVADKAAGLIGDGFYGVDIKEIQDECLVMEVNDNPSVESGVEDQVLRDELYRRVAGTFLARIEHKKSEATRP